MGRVNVILRPGDQIPPDCVILRAFDEPRQWNTHCLTVEAAWLDVHGDPNDLWVLEAVEMAELWRRRQKALHPAEVAALDGLR